MPTMPAPMSSMPMPQGSWLGAAASFIGMWVVMMAAMMLPSLVPELLRYRRAVGRTGVVRLGRLTAIAGAGYFTVWTVAGTVVFLSDVVLDEISTRHPALEGAAPIAVGIVIAIAGALQFTAWKAHHLACCRSVPGHGHGLSPSSGAAWRHGLWHGLHCVSGCAGLMAICLAIGMMDLRAMTFVTAAITAERLAPESERIVRVIGTVAIVTGAVLFVRAV